MADRAGSRLPSHAYAILSMDKKRLMPPSRLLKALALAEAFDNMGEERSFAHF